MMTSICFSTSLCGRGDGSQDLRIAPEVPTGNELLYLIVEVVTILRVIAIILVEPTVLRSVPQLSGTLQRVGCPQQPLLFDMKEDFRRSGIQGRRRWTWIRWLWSIRTPPHGLQGLPSGLLGAGPFVVARSRTRKNLDGRRPIRNACIIKEGWASGITFIPAMK
ncbi:hypothetical protein GW17_00057025 [Ensete ventricosum]|nr:hypothetical protein GW17_00057025 [Ensete ventricosum]